MLTTDPLSLAGTPRRRCPFEVLFVASGLDGPNRGGIQHSAELAWEALRQANVGRPCALLSYGDERSRFCEEALGREARARSRREMAVNVLTRRWGARQVLFWHLGLVKLLPLLRVGPARVQVFLHGIEAWRPLGWLTSRCLNRVSQFLCNSEFTWQRFLEYHPRFAGAPHRVVHLGMGDTAGNNGLEPADPPVALMLGRLMRAEAYKGHHEMISLWPRLRARIPGARLWIAGDGDLRADLEKLASSCGCGDSVVFWGRVSEAKKEELLLRCRCLALPSRGEGFGIVYLEAMRLGRPCLVSQQDAGREVVNPPEAGLAADPDDASALTEALARLLQAGPEWTEWSQAARRRHAGRFTAADFQARLLQALGEG